MATRDTLPIRTRESLSHNEKLGPDATDANAKPHKNPNGEKNQKNQKNKKNGTAKENTGRFTGYYGTNFDGLDPWVRLCRDLGVEGPLNSKKQCKKALEKVFVNICDFLRAVDQRNAHAETITDPTARAAARKAPVNVKFFSSEQKLSSYTLNSNRVYPRKEIKAHKDHPLKLLMAHILFPQPGKKAKQIKM